MYLFLLILFCSSCEWNIKRKNKWRLINKNITKWFKFNCFYFPDRSDRLKYPEKWFRIWEQIISINWMILNAAAGTETGSEEEEEQQVWILRAGSVLTGGEGVKYCSVPQDAAGTWTRLRPPAGGPIRSQNTLHTACLFYWSTWRTHQRGWGVNTTRPVCPAPSTNAPFVFSGR